MKLSNETIHSSIEHKYSSLLFFTSCCRILGRISPRICSPLTFSPAIAYILLLIIGQDKSPCAKSHLFNKSIKFTSLNRYIFIHQSFEYRNCFSSYFNVDSKIFALHKSYFSQSANSRYALSNCKYIYCILYSVFSSFSLLFSNISQNFSAVSNIIGRPTIFKNFTYSYIYSICILNEISTSFSFFAKKSHSSSNSSKTRFTLYFIFHGKKIQPG